MQNSCACAARAWSSKKRWKTSCHPCLQDSSVSYNRVFILHCDMAEFNQHTDEQECSLILCTRMRNAEWVICSLSCDRQVAVSFYSQIMGEIRLRQWNHNKDAHCCLGTKSVSLISHVLSPHNCSFCFWYSVCPSISVCLSVHFDFQFSPNLSHNCRRSLITEMQNYSWSRQYSTTVGNKLYTLIVCVWWCFSSSDL